MPSAWSLIETSFPTFSGEEKVRDQMGVLLNYMYVLTEGLKYQMSNLGAQNFNSTSLKNIQIETTADVEAVLEQMAVQVESILSAIKQLQASLADVKEWEDTAAQDLKNLSDQQGALEKQQGEFEKTLADVSESLDELKDIFKINDDGSLTIGGNNQTLKLVGQVYINGILIE